MVLCWRVLGLPKQCSGGEFLWEAAHQSQTAEKHRAPGPGSKKKAGGGMSNKGEGSFASLFPSRSTRSSSLMNNQGHSLAVNHTFSYFFHDFQFFHFAFIYPKCQSKLVHFPPLRMPFLLTEIWSIQPSRFFLIHPPSHTQPEASSVTLCLQTPQQ